MAARIPKYMQPCPRSLRSQQSRTCTPGRTVARSASSSSDARGSGGRLCASTTQWRADNSLMVACTRDRCAPRALRARSMRGGGVELREVGGMGQ